MKQKTVPKILSEWFPLSWGIPCIMTLAITAIRK